MVNAIWSSKGLARGRAILARSSTGKASVKQSVHDGDTLKVEADGNFGVRFLGIDTPEISLTFPKTESFKNISPHFKEYLTNPFSSQWDDSADYKKKIGSPLLSYLNKKLGPKCAENHFQHAKAAERELEKFIQADIDATSSTNFRFFLAFAHEIMDRYGRFLCYVHQDLPPAKRKGNLSYNEKMLRSGRALPYFMFPNIDPFRKPTNPLDAIPDPNDFREKISKAGRLAKAREYVRNARKKGLGIFDKKNLLLLNPFELRFLARRQVPDRYVIDLSKATPKLIAPTNYFKIPNEENRLFVNPEHVPLFAKRGYQIEK